MQVFIPFQQELETYFSADTSTTPADIPLIVNQRYFNFINHYHDLYATAITYDEKYLNLIRRTDSAVLIPGGNDIGDFPDRDQFDFELIHLCIAEGIPLIGICKGMQEINVALGGTLKNIDNHWQLSHPIRHAHSVILNEGRILDQFVSREIDVNSFHHQAVDEVGDRIIVEGISNDGIIECISVEGVPAYGFQWHPSFCPNYWVSERILELFKPW